MSTRRVVVCDLGLGNLRSVERAVGLGAGLVGASVDVVVTADPTALRTADRVIVPGQGAFRDGAAALASGFGEAIRDAVARGTPYLGICLGLQLLFEGSDEAPGAKGLGLFAGTNRKLVGDATTKIPHMGWSRIETTSPPQALARAVAESDWFYFVHSFHAVPDDPSLVVASARHGANVVTAAVARDHVLAVQFHPEKSQRAGLLALGGFVA